MKSIAIVFTKSKEKSGPGAAINRPSLPHPLLNLGSYLKNKKVEVYLIDGQVCDAKEELEKIIGQVDIIGFSVMTMQVSNSLELSDYIKQKYPEKKIIWGGIHPSLLPEQTIKDHSIDYVCQREGEGCLYELCSEKPLNKIKNLVYKKDEKIIINPIREFIDLNKEDKPVWNILDLEKYIIDTKFREIVIERSLPLAVGRGCLFNCAFCVNTILGKKWRALSSKEMIKRMKFLKEKYDIQHFNLADDCFDADLKRVEDFCNTLIKEKLNVTWDVGVRAGNKWTDERMALLSKAGCLAVLIGAESGSDRILKMVTKGITTKDILYMAEQCNKHNILLISSWICGLPTETDEDLKKTISLLKKVTQICPNCTIGFNIFRPYPNSALYFEAEKQGFKTPKSLREWAVKSHAGFLSGGLPWVKNYNKLKAIEFYCMNAFRYPRNIFHSVLVKFSNFRLKHNFYFFPFEIALTKFYVENLFKIK